MLIIIQTDPGTSHELLAGERPQATDDDASVHQASKAKNKPQNETLYDA